MYVTLEPPKQDIYSCSTPCVEPCLEYRLYPLRSAALIELEKHQLGLYICDPAQRLLRVRPLICTTFLDGFRLPKYEKFCNYTTRHPGSI